MSSPLHDAARPPCDVRAANVAFETEEVATNEVRQALRQDAVGILSQPLSSPLAHPSDRLLIPLNSHFQVVDDDLQYILQRRNGTTRSKAKGWVGRSFCRTRAALLRRIREYCGIVDQGALEQVRSLPEWHVDR